MLNSLQGQSSHKLEIPNMARRRYQKGSLKQVDNKWVGRWREDVLVNGQLKRINRKEVLGTLKDYPTKRLAQRALDSRLAPINSPTYRARPTITIEEFWKKWESNVVQQYKPT